MAKFAGIKKGTELLVGGKVDYDQFAHDIAIIPNFQSSGS